MDQLFPEHIKGLEPLSIYDDLQFPELVASGVFVALNMVSSIDGKITFNRNERRAPIGSPIDRTLMGRLRVHFDAVIRGAETVRANPFLPSVPDEAASRREKQGQRGQPLTIVLSQSLDLPFRSAFFYNRDQVVILTSGQADPEKLEEAREKAHVEVVGDEAVDLQQALQVLNEKYGIRRLLVEGGGRLNHAFFQAGLIDEVFWTLAPRISGLEDDLTMIYGPEMIDPVPRLTLKSLHVHDSELFHRWSVDRS